MVSHSLSERFVATSQDCVHDGSGIAAIEFAVIAPVLILIFICLADLGLGISAKMQVDNAAQYGAQYALTNGYNASAITAAVKNSSDMSNLNVAPALICGCPGQNGVLPRISCVSPCADGSTPGSYARVSVTHTYVTLLPYPGLPSSFNLASQSTVRLQ
jgi:Flp pilus assembly protein TadG